MEKDREVRKKEEEGKSREYNDQIKTGRQQERRKK